MSKTRNFADVLRSQLAKNSALAELVELEGLNADIATQIIACRKEARLTQTQLAELTDTHQSVIARLEDADYEGHSLGMLQRIARALGKKLTVEFCVRPQYLHMGTAIVTEAPRGPEEGKYHYQIEIEYATDHG